MKNLFNDISNDERQRILEMHQNATKRNYLNEQPVGSGPTGETNSPPTQSDPFIALLSSVRNADTFSKTPIEDPTADLVTYFGFAEIPAVKDGEQPDPKVTETRTKTQELIKAADKYYVLKKVKPEGTTSLTKQFELWPIVGQLTSKQGSNAAKFTKDGLDRAYYKYLNEKLNKVKA